MGIIVPAGLGWDFANFYDAGRRILAGQVSDLYSPRTPIDGQSPLSIQGFWGAPLSAFLYVPFALVSPAVGLVLFKIQTAIFSLAALILLYRHCQQFTQETAANAGRYAAVFALMALAYQPLWTAFRTGGQTTPFVFFLLVLTLRALAVDRPRTATLCFAAAVMVKPVLISAVVFFVVAGGFRYVRDMTEVFVMAALVSIGTMGWEVHARFVELMLTGMGWSVGWFYNSGLDVVFENLRISDPSAPGQGPTRRGWTG